MLIAQITDIHLGFDPDEPAEYNRKRLERVIDALCRLDRQPDLLLATGDLVDRGDIPSYARLKRALAACPFPVYMCVGNHDERANFLSVFPHTSTSNGFVQYAFDAGPLRFLVLDTLEEGRHGGAFCAVRAAWLRARLNEAPDRPTIIVLHHPPIETGIAWMTANPGEAWIERLDEAMAGHAQIAGIMCGHIHRSIVAGWRGRPLTICSSTAPQVALTMSPMNPAQPDGRPMIVADAPAYALHLWTGNVLITHFDTAEEHIALARFDKSMQPLVAGMLAEHKASMANAPVPIKPALA